MTTLTQTYSQSLMEANWKRRDLIQKANGMLQLLGTTHSDLTFLLRRDINQWKYEIDRDNTILAKYPTVS